jgi:hypothetical protein
MDPVTIGLIGMIVVFGLTIYIGFAVTLGMGEYDVAWGQEWIWIFYIASLVTYIISAAAVIGFGAYGVGTIAMAISLFSDYVLGWAVGDKVVMKAGGTGPFVGIKYTSFVIKTILLPWLAYLAGQSGFGGKYFGTEGKFGNRLYRGDRSASDFRAARGANPWGKRM